jgi:hypothetical protein
MTVNTLWNVAVCIGMAEVTSESFVLAGTGDHLLAGASMTRDTDCLMLAFKIDI